MHAETVELLMAKGHFPTEQALAVAEAIDMAIGDAQLVTVPILDARMAKLDAQFAAVDARFEALQARIDARFERLRGNLIVAVVVIIAAHAAFGPAGVAALKAVRTLL